MIERNYPEPQRPNEIAKEYEQATPEKRREMEIRDLGYPITQLPSTPEVNATSTSGVKDK